jgi:hypothetical protein
MTTWFAVARSIWDHEMFAGEPYSPREAWLWIVSHAAVVPTTTRIGNATIELDRGEIACSIRHLAAQWGWQPSRVHRFLAQLASPQHAMIALNRTHKVSVLKILNYKKYQYLPPQSWNSKQDSPRNTSRDTEFVTDCDRHIDDNALAQQQKHAIDDLTKNDVTNSEQNTEWNASKNTKWNDSLFTVDSIHSIQDWKGERARARAIAETVPAEIDINKKISDQANRLSGTLAAICGHDIRFIPPSWCGAALRIEAWLRNGWREDLIIAIAKSVAARRSQDGMSKIASVEFLEQRIADAHVRLNKQIAKGRSTNGHKRSRYLDLAEEFLARAARPDRH